MKKLNNGELDALVDTISEKVAERRKVSAESKVKSHKSFAQLQKNIQKVSKLAKEVQALHESNKVMLADICKATKTPDDYVKYCDGGYNDTNASLNFDVSCWSEKKGMRKALILENINADGNVQLLINAIVEQFTK